MDRTKFREDVEALIALAGQISVESHTRKTKSGKVVQVQQYTRSPGDMSNTELFSEYKALTTGQADIPETQKRSRLAQVVSEITKRKDAGKWGHTRQSDKTQAAQRAPKDKGTGHTSREGFDNNRNTPKGKMTDAEYSDHVDRIKAILKDPANQKYDTQRMHGIKDPETGKPIPGYYTPERTEQHKAIIEDILAKHANVPTERKAMMSGGLGGAGKGYVLKGFADVDQSQFLTIDPDEMKAELLNRGMVPEVPGLLPMEHANFIHEESSDLANLLHQVAMDRGMNIILDTTMASVGSVEKKLKKFTDQGYEVEAVFVDVPVSVSVESALGRHRGGIDRYRAGDTKAHGDLGGRFVPPEYIQSAAPPPGSPYNSKNREAFEELKEKGAFTRARVFDTSDRTVDPKLVSDDGKGASKKTDPSKTTAKAMQKLTPSEQKVAASHLPSVERLIALTRVN